jgi:hypothetical protein
MRARPLCPPLVRRQGNRAWAGHAIRALPVAGEGWREGRFHKLRLATQSLRRAPLTRNWRDERANSDLSPQARAEANASGYKLNTYSIEAVDVFFSSGKFCMMLSG